MILSLKKTTLVQTMLGAALLLLLNLSFAEIAPPPAMSSSDSKPTKKSKSIKLQSKTQDKPNETQEQFPIPDLVIRYKDGAKIEEYRINGQLRYAKITPKVGPPYYLVDSTGDGRFDKRHNQLENPPIQTWLLYSW